MDFGMLGAITGLIGAGLSASAQANQQEIELENLMFQKQQARKQERMSQATRTDAYGNQQYYDPLSNEWVTKLTPTQKQITTSGEQEQLRSLTVDAKRNRDLRARQEQRSLGAEQPYNTAVQGYINNQPESEQGIRGDLETLMAGANQDQLKANQDTLAREAIRLGRGQDIPRLIKATDDQLGQDLPSVMLQARQGALAEHAARVQAHDATYLPEISKWAQIIDDGGGTGAQRFSTVPQELDQIQGQQSSAMMQALQNASTNIGGAYNAFAKAAGESPDLSKIAKGLSDQSSGSGKKKKSSGDGESASDSTPQYSLTNTNAPWDSGLDWGSTPDYLGAMDFSGGGGFLF